MKKLLTLAVLLVFVAGSAFAGATSVTKEQSLSDYPGELNPGSVTGANTFITDISLMANTAMFEYLGDAYGLIALDTDLGIIGISVSPAEGTYLDGINVNRPTDVFGLQFVTPIAGMNVGLGVLYGIDNTSWSNKEIVDSPENPDYTTSFEQYVGAKVGASIKGSLPLDVGLSVILENESLMERDLENTTDMPQLWKDTTDNSKITAKLAARAGLGNGITAAVIGNFAMGQMKFTEIEDLNNNDVNEVDQDEIYTNMGYGASALIGKEIKASETMKIKMAAGAAFSTYSQALYLVDDRVSDTKVYNDTSYSSVTVRLPINFAVEGKLNDTWTINAGTHAQLLYGNVWGDKLNPDTEASKFEDTEVGNSLGIDPNLSFDVGVTGKIGDLTLDMHIEPSILLQGPYMLTGSGSGALNLGIALSYNWK